MVDLEQVRALHAQGFTDPRIARELGCVATGSVWWVRHKLGLIANWHARIDHDRLRELWSQGLTDAQIAAEMGIGIQSVRGARYTIGLSVHRAHVRQHDWPDYKFTAWMGDPMESALTPEQAPKMRMFLRCLLTYANQQRSGERSDVNYFIKEYIRSGVGD